MNLRFQHVRPALAWSQVLPPVVLRDPKPDQQDPLVWSNHFINYSPFHAMGTGQEFDKAEDFGELNELKDFHQKLVKSIRNFYSLDSDESLPAELFWLNTVQSKLDQIDAEWQSIQQK